MQKYKTFLNPASRWDKKVILRQFLYRSTKLNKNANLHAARGFKAEDFESVRNTWGTGGIKTVTLESYVQLHVATGTLFFTLKCGSLVDEILNGSWAPGEYIVGI